MFGIVLAACDKFKFSVDCLDTIQQSAGYQSPKDINALFEGPFGITALIFMIAGLLIGIYIISAGIGFMTSQGNPQAIAANRQKLINAFAGFILLFAAYWIVQLVGTILGLQGITQSFPQ